MCYIPIEYCMIIVHIKITSDTHIVIYREINQNYLLPIIPTIIIIAQAAIIIDLKTP